MVISACRALVTGGASGIGAAIADDLRERGARVAVADRAHDAEIVADLSRPGSARRMVEAAVEELVLEALKTRPIEEIAPPPATLLRVSEVVAEVRRAIEDDSLSGAVVALSGGEPPQLRTSSCRP